VPDHELTRESAEPCAGSPSDHREALQLRVPTSDDGMSLWSLAGRTGLDANSAYAYVLWGEHFAETSVIAAEAGRVLGFVMAFREPREPGSLFVWQVAVEEAARGKGLAGRMLDHLVAGCRVRHVDATVNPSNRASAALFRALATRHGTAVVERELFRASAFPAGHESEVLFRVGPFR
jgi:L-2,4-diaminobutyric acid acetyltransferase